MYLYTVEQYNFFKFLYLFYIANILYSCGKDMAEKYGLHHWDNSYLKTLMIVIYYSFKNSILLVFSDNKPVATFQIKQKNKKLHFEKLATLPNASKSGIGSFCLSYIESLAKKLACSHVNMEVYASAEHAILFYKNRNYSVVGKRQSLKYPLIVMEKQL